MVIKTKHVHFIKNFPSAPRDERKRITINFRVDELIKTSSTIFTVYNIKKEDKDTTRFMQFF